MKYVKRTLGFLALSVVWLGLSVYGGLSGWWLKPVAPEHDTQAFVRAIEQQAATENHGNVAFVLIEDHKVVAENFSGITDHIDRNTLFPLASMSKLFTAVGLMQLADAGKIDLDAPINNYLSRWQLPASEFDNNRVTARQLLAHTSGLNDGLGFGDYKPKEKVPSLVESLNQPRASKGNKTIALGREPGEEWEYSGGGYLIAQLLIEETSGVSFEQWMQQSVFTPLEMDRSTYGYLGDQNNIANSYDNDGKRAVNYRYASAAATGLSSTAADLTKFALALAQIDNASSVLKPQNINMIRQAQGYTLGAAIWGTGTMLYAPSKDGAYIFGHDGANDPAINTALRINPDNGDAIIVLNSGNPALASAIAYEWTLWQTSYPDILSLDKAIKSALVPSAVGVFIILVLLVIFWRRRGNGKLNA